MTLGAGNAYGGETVWSGGGGGTSTFETQPTWQLRTVPTSLRGLPDVAFDANPSTGIKINYNGGFSGPWGGTSLASPIFVGLFARLQSAANDTLPFPGRWLYRFPVGRRASSFHDVTSGSNGAYSAAVGWDFTTGFGSLVTSKAQIGIKIEALPSVVSFVLNN